MDDGASLYWRLGGTAAQGGNDLVGQQRRGRAVGHDLQLQRRAVLGARPVVHFNGTSSGYLNATNNLKVGQQYSTELWFKTTTSSGGKLIGFGNSATGSSSTYDRHVYMRNDGRLVYGTYPASPARSRARPPTTTATGTTWWPPRAGTG